MSAIDWLAVYCAAVVAGFMFGLVVGSAIMVIHWIYWGV